MKLFKLHILIGIVLCCISCSEEYDTLVRGHVPATFTTCIAGSEEAPSRAFDGSWEVNDRIGIYMSGSTVLPNDAAFRAYNVTDVDKGTLTPHSPSDTWIYPQDDSDVWFYAFYPYGSSAYTQHGNILTFTMPSNQSGDHTMSNFDFLYYKNDNKNYSGTYPHAALALEHRFSKIEIHVTAGEGMSTEFMTAFANLTLTLGDFPNTADCNLVDGSVASKGTNISVTPRKSSTVTGKATFEAIVFPHTAATAPEVTFNLPMAGLNEPLTFALNKEFVSGTSYVYYFTLGVNKVDLTGSFARDWVDGNKVDIEVGTPVEGANCYIVPTNSQLRFPVKHAHRFYSEMNNFESSTVPFLDENESFYVEVLWTDTYAADAEPTGNDIDESEVIGANGAIKSVAMDTPGCFGHIKVETGSKEGNAVIALRRTDADGDILFSWHIWVTDYDPSTNIKYWDNGKRTTYFMDRNLGATSASNDSYGSFGLLYQWGRKDPFVGTRNALYTEEEPFVWLRNKGTSTYMKTQPYIDREINSFASDGKRISIATSLGTPFKFYKRTASPFDWCLNIQSATYLLRWNNRWNRKSLDDPCPPGWRVSRFENSRGPWYGLTVNNWEWYDTLNDNILGGRENEKIGWWPTTGRRSYKNGSLTVVGTEGTYWDALQNSSIYYHRLIFDREQVNTVNTNNGATNGCSIRCTSQ